MRAHEMMTAVAACDGTPCSGDHLYKCAGCGAEFHVSVETWCRIDGRLYAHAAYPFCSEKCAMAVCASPFVGKLLRYQAEKVCGRQPRVEEIDPEREMMLRGERRRLFDGRGVPSRSPLAEFVAREEGRANGDVNPFAGL